MAKGLFFLLSTHQCGPFTTPIAWLILAATTMNLAPQSQDLHRERHGDRGTTTKLLIARGSSEGVGRSLGRCIRGYRAGGEK